MTGTFDARLAPRRAGMDAWPADRVRREHRHGGLTMSASATDDGVTRPQALADLASYPFLSALTERRTRRVPRGLSVDAGSLSHASSSEPAPLSRLEEAILITCVTGITGSTTHDGPLTGANGQTELGTPFLNIMGRTASSAENAQATHFFMINDDGIFLLRPPKGQRALELLRSLPRQWGDWTEADWIGVADECLVRVSNRRLDFPREWPYFLDRNRRMSNAPGTTIFFPVVDCTWQYINAILSLLTDPSGMRPVFLDDWRTFHPKNASEWMAKLAGGLGIGQKIPYHPIGGLDRIRSGYLDTGCQAPLGYGNTLRTDQEAYFHLQNLMLLGQSMGLGGWIHSAVLAPYIWQQDDAKGWHGLGFRLQEPKRHRSWPPAPASQANPVGIDGILEGLTPPYVSSMDEAVERVIEAKFSASGAAYGNERVFAGPYRSVDDARAFLERASLPGPEEIAYTKEICNYIWDTYGRFPAHVDAFHTLGTWLQFAHLEQDYYERFFDPSHYARQAGHDDLWHG